MSRNSFKQGLFEGTKAYKRDNGRLFLFRPHLNAIRIQIGAERMCMPCPSTDQFVDAVKQIALANKRWVIIFLNHSVICLLINCKQQIFLY